MHSLALDNRKRLFDVLVVREIDRLSRNLAKQLIVEEMKRDVVQIEYVLGEFPDTPEGNFMKQVRASVAEYEREKIMDGATYENKLELIEQLNLRVQLVHDGDEYRVGMTCDLPDSNYAEIIRRKNTMRNFCIRVNASIPLPRRNKKGVGSIMVGKLPVTMMLLESS